MHAHTHTHFLSHDPPFSFFFVFRGIVFWVSELLNKQEHMHSAGPMAHSSYPYSPDCTDCMAVLTLLTVLTVSFIYFFFGGGGDFWGAIFSFFLGGIFFWGGGFVLGVGFLFLFYFFFWGGGWFFWGDFIFWVEKEKEEEKFSIWRPMLLLEGTVGKKSIWNSLNGMGSDHSHSSWNVHVH